MYNRNSDVQLGCGMMTVGCFLFTVIFIALVLFSTFLWGGAFWLVWNFVVVPVFGVTTVTFFWQSIIVGFALSLVSSLFTNNYRANISN